VPPPLQAAAAHGIAYRPMTDEDLPFVARLYASTRAREVAATGWPAEMQAAFLDQQHRAQHMSYRGAYPDAEWLIVEQGGDAIGRVYLAETADELLLIDISFLPDRTGQGLGGAILADLLAFAGAKDKRVGLHVEKFNPAKRLYERLGFTFAEDNGLYERMEWRPSGGP
jgi:ribosomal protein S18 acetylase RimI-like enzyme